MDIFKIFLWTHIASGTIGLLSGTAALIKKKGDKQHSIIGKVFFIAMLLTGFSSLVLSVIHPNPFLFIIGVFTLYQALTGQIYLRHRKQQVSYYEWLLTGLMLVVAFYLVGSGVFKFYQDNNFGIVQFIFGVLALMMVKTDYQNYTGKSAIKNFWLVTHFQRMIGAYIAALTAFLVVNNTLLPGVVAWLLPTALLVPLIIKWTKQHSIQKN